MAAEEMQFPWRWNVGMIAMNLKVIWEMSAEKKQSAEEESSGQGTIQYSPDAEKRLARVPEGFMRDMTRQRVEAFARRNGVETITPDLIERKYAEWGKGSAKQKQRLEWDDAATERIARIPDFVRGMVMLEIERCAREAGSNVVTEEVIDAASGSWEKLGAFHSGNTPEQYKE